MVQSYEVIALFWGGALLIWIELRLQGINARTATARKSLRYLAGYFLTSLGLLSIAALIDYAVTQTTTFLELFYQNALFTWIEEACFGVALVTLAAGLIGVQRLGIKRNALPTITTTIGVGMLGLFNTALLLSLVAQGAYQSTIGLLILLLFMIGYLGVVIAIGFAHVAHGNGPLIGIALLGLPYLYIFIIILLQAFGVRF